MNLKKVLLSLTILKISKFDFIKIMLFKNYCINTLLIILRLECKGISMSLRQKSPYSMSEVIKLY